MYFYIPILIPTCVFSTRTSKTNTQVPSRVIVFFVVYKFKQAQHRNGEVKPGARHINLLGTFLIIP